MLQPRLTTCLECTDISTLLDKIDCKLSKLGTLLYGNITLMLNNSVSAVIFIDLLNYRRILTFKQVNSEYCDKYTVEMIASKVSRLVAGVVCKSCECDDYSTTTSTTTHSTITTTTTSGDNPPQ